MLINRASGDPRFQNHPGLRRHGIESYIAVPLHRRDGSYFGTLCALDPQPADLGEADLAIFHLLSQLIAFELEADERQQQREAEVRAMEDFLAIAAHDLRQPLSVLQGYAQLIARRARRGAPPEDLVRSAESLLAQVRRAVRLSDVLLDLARIESGGFRLDKAPFDLAALARQTVEESQGLAPDHSLHYDGPAALVITGDAQRMGQVLHNLLDNAVKYSPDRYGPVELSLRELPGAGESARLTVADSGIGVPAEELPHLFERRYRAPNAVARSIGGSGLGLYITQQIVVAHGGHIWAEQAPSGGLAVHVELPSA